MRLTNLEIRYPNRKDDLANWHPMFSQWSSPTEDTALKAIKTALENGCEVRLGE
jgi:hypothetical protein